MSERYDYGVPDLFEIVWRTGAVDRVTAHQVTWPNQVMSSLFSAIGTKTDEPWVRFHAEIDGHWKLMLQAREADLMSVRNVTQVGEAK